MDAWVGGWVNVWMNACMSEPMNEYTNARCTQPLACCAALSSQAGRNQRALPDKRARRKPGWLDNTVDPKTAAQLAFHPTAEVGLAVTSMLHNV